MEKGLDLPVKEIEVITVYGYRYVKRKKMGDIEIELPEPPPLEQILNYDKPILEQRFQYHDFIPFETFKKMPADDRETYLDKIWEWRRKGLFFLNKGNIEYLTGLHWFQLNCFKDKGRTMLWYDSDRDFWHWWDWIEKNPKILGGIYSTNRREGKTAKALTVLLEYGTSEYEKICGMQSKTNDDSEEYFERLVEAWQRLPVYFKPIHTGVKNPKTELVFKEPSTRQVKNNEFEYYKVLKTKINFKSSKEKAYDGQPVHRMFQDEIGKTTEANVAKRWDVVRPCLMEGLTKVIGKAICVTTVENEEGESRTKSTKGLGQSVLNFKKLWDGSDINDLNENGMTKTGLVRYFKSSIYGMRDFVDEYGYSNPYAANEFIENTLAQLDGDEALAFRRKYPRSEDDMWGTMGEENGLDLNKIIQQRQWNKEHVNNGNIKVQRGNFEWVNQFGGNVMWVPTPNGKWSVCWLPKMEDANKSFIRNGQRVPSYYLEGVIGVDPIDDTNNTEDKKSNFASATFRKGGLSDSMYNNCFTAIYLNRFTYPETHFEDMLKQAIFYGYQICIEDNRVHFKNWLRERGFAGYLTPRPQETVAENKSLTELDYGIPTTGQRVRDLIYGYLQIYVYQHCGYTEQGGIGNVFFDEILDDWTKFKPAGRWTKYDLSVATMMALAGANGTSYFKQPVSTVSISLPRYTIKDSRSVRVN